MTRIMWPSSRDASQERAVLTQDAAGLFHSRDTLNRSGIPSKRFAVFLIRIKIRKIDQRESCVCRPGEFRRQEVTDKFASTATDRFRQRADVFLEIPILILVDCVANAERNHLSPPSKILGSATRLCFTRG